MLQWYFFLVVATGVSLMFFRKGNIAGVVLEMLQ
jgi:hypothetical protein